MDDTDSGEGQALGGGHPAVLSVLGKHENCQVAVSVSLPNQTVSVPAAWRLYLPEPWARDPELTAVSPRRLASSRCGGSHWRKSTRCGRRIFRPPRSWRTPGTATSAFRDGSPRGASRTRLASRGRRPCGRRGSSRCCAGGTRGGDAHPPGSEGMHVMVHVGPRTRRVTGLAQSPPRTSDSKSHWIPLAPSRRRHQYTVLRLRRRPTPPDRYRST